MSYKILVVDDEPDMELLITQRFRKQIREGLFSFVFANDGNQALEKLNEHIDINLMLTDINMPGMDGLTLLGKVKLLERPISALVVSAYGDIKNIRTAMNQGAFDFLTKPLDFQDFEITINKSIENVRFVLESLQNQKQLEVERDEKIKAQDLALRTAEEKAEFIAQQNQILEQKVEERTAELKIKNDLITKEKERSDNLLLNILPFDVAQELKETGKSLARFYSEVTVLFTDFKDFTKISENLSPQELVQEIDDCFRAFDDIITKHGLEKIKTIGDAYMAVSGLPNMSHDSAIKAIEAAQEIRDYMQHRTITHANGVGLKEIRIGIHTGAVVAGIVGHKKFAFDIWGDTVNTAARMEQNSDPGKINISDSTYQLVKSKFDCLHRGKIQAKNKGEIDMYFVN
jgi:class 3 adenylate cyclase/response regulator of citrate/malate metabolism